MYSIINFVYKLPHKLSNELGLGGMQAIVALFFQKQIFANSIQNLHKSKYQSFWSCLTVLIFLLFA